MGATDTGDGAASTVDEENGGLDDARLQRLARYGLFSRGLVHAVVGLLAGRMAFGSGGGGGEASTSGAFDAISDQPLGLVLLVATAIGLLVYATYQLLLVYTGPDHDTSLPDWMARLRNLARGLVYLGLSGLAGKEVFGSSGGNAEQTFTQRVLDLPVGPWLVGAVGLGLIAVGVAQLVRAVRFDWADKLSQMGMADGEQTWTHRLGQVGYTGRAVAYGLVGAFVVRAAVTHDPSKGGGLDAALEAVRTTPVGTGALLLIGIMLLAFGLFTIQEARHRDL